MLLFFSFAGRAGRAGAATLKPAGELYTGASKADEGGVDLANAGQCQHDLSPVLRVLLKRVSFKVDRLQRLSVLQLIQIRPVVYLIIIHLGGDQRRPMRKQYWVWRIVK